jgi:hypothetical protein
VTRFGKGWHPSLRPSRVSSGAHPIAGFARVSPGRTTVDIKNTCKTHFIEREPRARASNRVEGPRGVRTMFSRARKLGTPTQFNKKPETVARTR